MVRVAHGIDILSVRRMELAMSRSGERFLRRIFTDAECSAGDGAEYFARIFASKEAFFKALGTGLSGGTRWHDIEVLTDGDGRTSASVTGRSRELLGDREILLSGAATSETAVALVVIS